ncbi:MAG: hypothetical protein JW821_01345 [Deltaproteobacteria bacterium]|nr:hypothetical protein [Deltaproteobacteria bacterium]
MFFVDANRMHRELVTFLYNRVEVTGKLRLDEEGDSIINVNQYSVLKDSEKKAMDARTSVSYPLPG